MKFKIEVESEIINREWNWKSNVKLRARLAIVKVVHVHIFVNQVQWCSLLVNFGSTHIYTYIHE